MDLALGKRLRQLPGPILVTGHTGFKGTWLTLLLERLGVPVVGLSLAPEGNSLFDRAGRSGSIPEAYADIRDINAVGQFMENQQPSAIVHMAAQPLVLESYKNPRETFETNVMGTVNVLDSAFKTNSVRTVAVITTDKVYRNNNTDIAFVESDALAGKDPYSASKVGTESAVAAWQQIARISGGPKVFSLRAGNVIGGGDWSKDRLIPDLIRGFMSQGPIPIRNPNSTRPWQHVLDPLRGYVMALEAALNDQEIVAMNFGPDDASLTVGEVVDIARKSWESDSQLIIDSPAGKTEENIEAISLNLDSTLARESLGWNPIWSQRDAVIATMEWWNRVLRQSINPKIACQKEIEFMLDNLIT